MTIDLDLNLPQTVPENQPLTLSSWKKGVITVADKSDVPKDALIEAQNLFLREQGTPTPRPGVDWYGVAASSNGIDGAGVYEIANSVPHLLKVAGGVVYRSLDNGATWTACTGANLTADYMANMNQYNSFMYITTGQDEIVRYDGTTTLQTYTTLTTPSAPSAAKTGLGGTSYTYYYKISAVNQIGFSAASVKDDIQVSLTRDSWDDSNLVTLTLPALQSGQTRYDVYISEDDLDYYYLGSASGTTFIDNGTAVVIPSTTAPTDNTTDGPRVAELSNVGSRMFGVRDTDNPYRIWFTSANTPKGAFSSAYDGGYLDWQEGGKYIPVQVEDYRDGKGTPIATIWCDSIDDEGCILQMSLDVLTIGDISITVPNAYQLPGSRGTNAPGSVVNVLNDYMYYNSQAFYNLGSRAQFLNLLSTDESSANIRPTIKRIIPTVSNKICSIFYDAKVYFSVPYSGTSNNYTIVYDTERKAWLPEAFTIGFANFFQYVDTDGTRHLLTWKDGDTRLSEISDDINGDYGEPFTTSLTTGLYPVSKNRFEFFWVEEGETEFSQPVNSIQIQLLGIDRVRGYSVIKTKTIDNDLGYFGWSSAEWSSFEWTDTSEVPSQFAPSSEKNYFRVQREINAYQWNIITSSLDSDYLLRTLQINGTLTKGGKPRTWRIPN